METIIEDGSFTIRPKRAKKVIDNYDMWMKAWNAYEKVLMTQHASAYANLVAYRELIHNCNLKYQWHTVLSYDIRFRTEMGKRRTRKRLRKSCRIPGTHS